MYNWINKLSKALMAAGLIILGSISVHAASSDAIMNQTMVNAALSRYGAAYESPFVVPPSGVAPSTGAVTGRTLELSLPGNNGLDLNLYRDYNSYDAFNAYSMYINTGRSKYVYGIAVPYTGYIDGTHRTVYVMYPREEDIEASIQPQISRLQSPDTDIYGQDYFERTALSEGTEVNLTWDKSQKPVHIELYGDYIRRTANNSADVEIADGWNIYIPSISEMFSSCSKDNYKVEIETASGTKTLTYTTFFYEVTAEMGMEDGSKETIKYKYFVSNEDNIVHWQSMYVVSGVSEYDVHIEEDGVVEDPRGFQYNFKITDQEGKTYYYYLPNPVDTAEGSIAAVGNRFGDVILYDHLINGEFDRNSWRIIDTYGRTILVRPGGITVNAGELTKQIDYRTSIQRDEVNNVSGGYETFDTHCLEVIEYSGNHAGGAEIKTTYKSKNKTLLGRGKQYFQKNARVILVLEEVEYPTNARREYVYEENPSGPQYLFGYKSPGTTNQAEYYAYRVIGEKLYEGDELKSDVQYSYSGTWTQNALYGRSFTGTETLENGKTKTTEYEYDMVGRIVKQYTQYYANKEKNTERIDYTYTRQVNDFSTDSERLKARRSSIQNISTTRNNKTISSVNSSYNRNKQPLLLQQGEKKTTNTYDIAYCLPLTQVSNRLDASDLKQVNTLTADKKNIAKTEVYEGSTLKNTTSYTYNSDETVASQPISNDIAKPVTNFA